MTMPPKILDGVSNVKIEMFGNVYALDARRVSGIVLWMIYIVSHKLDSSSHALQAMCKARVVSYQRLESLALIALQ